MQQGWTGGQWSLVRAIGAAFLVVWTLGALHAATSLLGFAGAAVALGAALSLGIGHRTRAAAAVALVWLVVAGASSGEARWYAAAWVLAVATMAETPYGAWDSRGRDRPGGNWQLPAWMASAAWGLFIFYHAARGLDSLSDGATLAGIVDLDLALFAFAGSLRALIWFTAAGVELGRFAAGDCAGLDGATWLVQVLALQPCWFPPRHSAATSWLFYDGGCALCHGAARFVLAEDSSQPQLRLAPLGGTTFTAMVPAEQQASLPDSIVVACDDGRVLVRSAAVLFVLDRVGGLWRMLAAVAGALPSRWLDAGYDAVAARRFRWFGRKTDSCPVADAELKARLDA